ncbi:MAG: hypothetical protein RIC55_15975 [Pirellulaceae bacterium]
MNARHVFWSLVGIVGLVALSGCIPSLNSVYTDDDLVFDEAVVGEWTAAEGESNWVFTKQGEKAYRLVYTEEDGKQGVFAAHLAKVDGVRFLDLYPEDLPGDTAGFYRAHQVPIHTVYLVRSVEPSLELVAIDLGWLGKHLAEHPEAIEHAGQENRILITAPTKELQQFLLKNLDRFTGEITLERVQPPTS